MSIVSGSNWVDLSPFRFRARNKTLLLASAAASVFGLAHLSMGSIVTWDASGTSAGAPTDGAGTWSTTNANWSNSTADNAWNNTNNDTAAIGNGGTGGAITVAAGGVNVGGINFNAVTAPYTISGGPITLATGTNAIVQNDGTTGGATINSALAGTGVTLNLSGNSPLNLLSSTTVTANTYTGTTNITNLTVNIGTGQNAAFSAPFGTAGNTLALSGATVNGAGSHSGGSISYTLPYNISVTGTNTINTGKSFSIGTNAGADFVYGSGTLIFNNNDGTTTGVTSTIAENFAGTGPQLFTGTLEVSGNAANNIVRAISGGGSGGSPFLGGIPNGSLDLEGTVAFEVATHSGTGNTVDLGALEGTSATAILGGNSNSGGGSPNYTVGGLGLTTTFAGLIQGNAALTVTGGSLTITNASSSNNNTGPTAITGGTLFDNGLLSAGSAVTVTAPGVLAGNGSVGGAVANGGIIAPGATSGVIGTLSFLNGLAFSASGGGVYDDDIDAAGASDVLAVTGALNLGTGSTLDVSVLDSTSGSSYTIATYTGTLTGTFATTDLPAGYTIDYGTGSNSSITLTPVVPEPATLALLGVGSLALLRRRRKRA